VNLKTYTNLKAECLFLSIFRFEQANVWITPTSIDSNS